MHILSRRTLIEHYERPGRQDSKGPLEAWHYEADHSHWRSPADVKDRYPSASILIDNRVVFNIGGNKYRLVVRINYDSGAVFVRFIGTHSEYDKIDAKVI